MHFYRFSDFADRTIYADDDGFFADLVAVYRQEIADLARAGCRYIQLDEVAIALLCDGAIRAKVEGAGGDPDALVDRYIDAINGSLADCPTEVTVGVHMCRGNFRGHYLGEGGYESVAERFFAGTNANHFLLEYDTPRAGDFAPLRFVPKKRASCSASSAARRRRSKAWTTLRRRTDEAASISISTAWRSARNAVLRPRWRAIR